jgi:hypothetical protein
MKQSNQTGIRDIADTLEVGEVFEWYGDLLEVTDILETSIFATKLKKDGKKGKLNTWWMNYKGEGYKNMVNTQSAYNRR